MSPDDNDIPQPPATDASSEAPAPKRRTRARKPAAETVTEAPASEAAPSGEAPAVAAEPAPAKPARAPRKPRVRAAVSAEAAVASEATAPAEMPVAVPVEVPVVVQSSAAPMAAPASAPMPIQEATPGPVDAVGSESAVGSQDGSPEGEADGEGRRGRNRRRGRRGGRADGEAAAGEAQGAGPVVVRPAAGVPVPDTGALFASVLAGEFDGEPDAADAGSGEPTAEPDGEDKRVLAPDADAPKLHKVLAQSGVGSRRDMEQMIEEGRITVNDEVAHVGMRISFGDRIAVDGKPVRVRIAPPPPRVIAYHKPVGEVVTLDDPQQRPTVFRKLPRLSQGKWQSVGRLDINTEGLLLFTTSGDLANKLMHPRFGIEREYAVRVLGTLEKEQKAQLLAGVSIEGQAAAFKAIEDGGGEGVNHWYRVVIAEGRNREVRKLFDAVGLTVSRLIRIRYGCVVLPRGLKRGVCVDLAEEDIKALRQLTDAQQPQGQRGKGAQEPRRDGKQTGQSQRQEGGKRGNQPGRGNDRGAEGRREAGAGDRPDRGPRGNKPRNDQPQQERAPRRPRDEGDQGWREPGDPSRIPNPLQQTFDKRAIQRERSMSREADYENGPIPNPLQQTYDKRFIQGERGFGAGGSGGRGGKSSRGGKGGGGGGSGQPDPMQTSVGYIGANAFTRKSQGRGGGGGGRRGGR